MVVAILVQHRYSTDTVQIQMRDIIRVKQVDLNMGPYSATNLPKRGVAILKIPAVPYASPMAIDYI